ncbi:MAG: thiamine phosphate synthase [Terriglobales bacterium]
MQPLYPILDAAQASLHGHDLVEVARGWAGLGLGMQQLRAKSLPDGEFLRLADRLAGIVPQLIINDRADIALLAGAAGVHCGQEDLPVDLVRRLQAEWTVGLSTHSLLQALEGLAQAPDYLAVGPVFATRTKDNPDPVVGLDLVRAAKREVLMPLVAIGGIGIENCAAVWAAGADAVAVIAGLWSAPDPISAASQFLLAFARVSCHSPG